VDIGEDVRSFWTRDGRLIASVGDDGVVRIWEVSSGQLLSTLQAHTGLVWSVSLSGDGRLVASGGDDGTVRLWETDKGQRVATLRGSTPVLHGVALSEDGSVVASEGTDRLVRLWEASSGRLLATPHRSYGDPARCTSRAVGVGGLCPACDEPVAISDLLPEYATSRAHGRSPFPPGTTLTQRR